MNFVRQVKAAFTAASLALIAIGACLLFRPALSAAVLCTVLGVISIIWGAVKLVGYFSNDLYRLAFQFDMALGILTVLIGCVLILHPDSVLAFLPVVIGVFILVDSALKLQTAIDAKHFGMKKWWAILAAAAAGALFGVLLLLRPFESALALMRLLGAALILDGGENLLLGLCTIKAPRRSSAAGVIEAEFTSADDDP